MANRVFVFGAGASKSIGVPLMNEFIDASADLRETGDLNDPRAFDLVFDLIQNRLPRLHAKSVVDLGNIESVFSLIEMARLVRRLPETEESEIDAAAIAIRRVLTETVEANCRFGLTDRGWEPPPTYLRIAGLVDPQITPNGTAETSLITFNYDVGLDFALHWSNIPIDYGLKSPERDSALLLKLHGSLNWVQCPSCGKVIPVSLKQALPRVRGRQKKEYRPISTQKARATVGTHCDGVSVPDDAALVPPTWNKTQYHEQFAPIWARAAKELSDAQDIVVAGYSLPLSDSFFRDLLALGLVGQTRLRSFVVVDPSEETAERFRGLLGPDALGRFEHLPMTFEAYCDQQLPSNSRLG